MLLFCRKCFFSAESCAGLDKGREVIITPSDLMGDRHQDIPTHNIFQDWEFADWQRFEPAGAITPGTYREIVLCWCVQGSRAAT